MSSEKQTKKSRGCLIVLVALFAVLVVVALATSRAREKVSPSPRHPMPQVSDFVDLDKMQKETAKPSPVPAPRRIVSNDFSEAHSAEAVDYAIGFVQEKHPHLKKAVFEVKNAGCVYFSDGTFDVSSWCDWTPQGQSVSVRSFFSVTMSPKNGEWFASNLKMSGWGF